MATFIRVDNKTINMDQVFEIDDYGDRIRVYYVVSSSDTSGVRQPSYSELDGAAAEALRRWIEENATYIGGSSAGQ